MRDNIMFYPAVVLMIVEAAAVIFLVCAWRKAKREHREYVAKIPPFARELMPMGAVTYAIACSHCKNRHNLSGGKCHRCRCEIESGFEVDPATFMKWIPVTERLPERGAEVIVCSHRMILPVVFTTNFWDTNHDNWLGITHWMPLPEPQKEVE